MFDQTHVSFSYDLPLRGWTYKYLSPTSDLGLAKNITLVDRARLINLPQWDLSMEKKASQRRRL